MADAPAPTPSRLDTALLQLLRKCPVGTLATLDAQGAPAVSLVPFALDGDRGDLVILISALAAHTAQLQAHPRAAVLLHADPQTADNVHALPRVSLEVEAVWPEPDTADSARAAAVYLARHPAAALLTQLPDFRWVRLRLLRGRQVAGFGAARSVDRQHLQTLICLTSD
jgi:putative heme iron utilization protein